MQRAGKLVAIIGVILVVVGFGAMLLLQHSVDRAADDAAAILADLKELIPPASIGTPEEYSSMEMPALDIGGRDVIGLIEVPRMAVELPLAAGWDTKTLISLPQRYSGSVYDSSLVIGGYDREGQFDFVKTLETGDEITVTDMTGRVFAYNVTAIDRRDDLKAELDSDTASALVLFVRDAHSKGYIIVRCSR